jgi:capsid protein
MSSPRKSSSWGLGESLAEHLKPRADSSSGGMSGFEGAQMSSTRSAFLTFPTNSFREMAPFTRLEMLRKVRALEANLGIFNRIKQTIRRRSVGRGIVLKPNTLDEEWNVLNRKQFENWGSAAHVYSVDASRDLWEDQALAAENLVADGEFFEALVRGDNGAPMVQPLDPYEISAGNGYFAPEGWQDGIKTNDFLRPIAYAVRELPGANFMDALSDKFRTVPADSMIHLFRRRRAKQTRGITWFFSGINQGIDALDLRALLTGTIKLHSAIAVVVKKTGKINKQGAFDKIKNLNGATTEPDTDVRGVEKIFGGGMINYVGSEGEIELKTSDRPSPNVLMFYKLLKQEIASGLGLPLEVVDTFEDLSGANTRLTSEDAQQFFDLIQDYVFWNHTRRIYIWNTAIRVKSGVIRPCRDSEWWKCTHRGPKKLTADNGRTAAANVLLLRNGAETHETLFEGQGLDAYDELMGEARLLERLEDNIRPSVFQIMFQPTPGVMPAEPDGDENEPKPGKKTAPPAKEES